MPVRRRPCAALLLALAAATGAWAADKPSFNCAKVPAGSLEALVCQDAELLRLGKPLAAADTQAAELALRQRPKLLPAAQRGWIKGRNGRIRGHQGALSIEWGVDAKPMRCVRKA